MDVMKPAELTKKKCVPCEGGAEACDLDTAKAQIVNLPGWNLTREGRAIAREWQLKNFVQTMALANQVAELAELEQHHPDIHITGYRNIEIVLTTHAIGGLSENDFILAAKIDEAATA